MYIVGREHMQQMDKHVIEQIGLPGVVLMENVGAQVIETIIKINDSQPKPVLVLAGGGNNGGDGFVIARRLNEMGWPTELCLLVPEQKIEGDAKVHYQAYMNQGFSIWKTSGHMVNLIHQLDALQEKLESASIIVDAILGTGFKGELREPLSHVIRLVNQCRTDKRVVAVDIPSGVCSDTGKVDEVAIRADMTVTFACPKIGFYMQQGPSYIGQLIIAPISVSPTLVEKLGLNCPELITEKVAKEALPVRDQTGHKGDFGHVLVIGGSEQYIGAPLFAGRAAFESGAGLVTLAAPESIHAQISAQYSQVMFIPLEAQRGYFAISSAQYLCDVAERFSIVAVGPGLGRWQGGGEWLRTLMQEPLPRPIIIDADALYYLSNDLQLLKQQQQPVILTPHPGEMAQLAGVTVEQVETDRLGVARHFAQKWGVFLLLKGHHTIITTPQGQQWINSTGNDALSKGGSGDVLTGLIASFYAQREDPLQAMIAASYMLGRTAEYVAQKMTAYQATPWKLINHMGVIFKELTRENEIK